MFLSRIIVYPIKSLDGVSVREAHVTSGGILENDRTYAIVDESGAYVNGKRTPRVQRLRAAFDEHFQAVSLWESGESMRCQFTLQEPAPLNQWLSQFLGFTVRLAFEPNHGFPDDCAAYGPTIVSEASLQEVGSWFPGLTVPNARRRFRTNLEIGGAPPFWEDRLFAGRHEPVAFGIGAVALFGHNSCQRCVVPARDPDSAAAFAGFQKTFRELRQKRLPAWAEREAFDHYYRFAVNTSIPMTEVGKALRVGDPVFLSVGEAGANRGQQATDPSAATQGMATG